MKLNLSRLYSYNGSVSITGHSFTRHSINHSGKITKLKPLTGILTIHNLGNSLKLYAQPRKK